MPRFTCLRCLVSIRPRAGSLIVDHCPRCIARDRVAVPMVRNDNPAGPPDVRLHGLNWRAGEGGSPRRE